MDSTAACGIYKTNSCGKIRYKEEINMDHELYRAMAQSIIDGDADLAEQLARQAVDTGIHPLEAINKGFVTGVNHVGDQFSCGAAFLPELVMAGEAMKRAVSALEPEMVKRGARRQVYGKVVLAT